jgi:hypothetical protein
MLSFLFNRCSIKLIASLYLGSVLSLMPLSWAAAQVEPNGLQTEKTALEIDKLRKEIAHLEQPAEKAGFDWAWWLATGGSFVAGSISAWAALRQRQGATDHPVHEKRLAIYPELVKITAPMAVYFPDTDKKVSVTLVPAKCADMGKALSEWYFGGGGMMMSVEAREAYFRLSHALTLASKSKTLLAPVFPRDSEKVNAKALDLYRSSLFKEIAEGLAKIAPKKTFVQRFAESIVAKLAYRKGDKLRQTQALALASIGAIEMWKFGGTAGANIESAAEPHQRFRDYVFLQNLSSKLRTALAADIRGRRRPD